MKSRILFTAALIAASACGVRAQKLPGTPQANGLTPKTDTIYVNSQATNANTINNGGSESIGIAIARNGNVLVGWEDDGDELTDLEAVWTLYDAGGAPITPDSTQNSLANAAWGSVTNRFLSFFRADKSATYSGAAWGPKIKANSFGDQIGMGATSFGLSGEIASYAPWDDANTGDTPVVQVLSNSGEPGAFLAGVSADYANRDGDIRIGDWDFLSNGNVLIVGESRQRDDLVNLYQGDIAEIHAIFTILNPTGGVVKAETLVSETPIKAEIWHGTAVTKDGFAVRIGTSAGVMLRMFDNAGNPTTTNIDLAAATGFALAPGTGRGGDSGFHGNGKDAYVLASRGTDPDDGAAKAWVTVLSTNGTVRFSRSVADDLDLASVPAVDAAIDADGKTIVVFSGKYDTESQTLIMGRRFDATGNPLGGTFYISEKELPEPATLETASPRIAERDGTVVVAWESKNDPGTTDVDGNPVNVVAMRYFSTTSGTGFSNIVLVPGNPAKVRLEWSTGTLQATDDVSGSSWTDVTGATSPYELDVDRAKRFMRLKP